LTVKSSIQPTKRPTGTDDDRLGNDKADALAGSDLERTVKIEAFSATSTKQWPNWPALPFYDISRGGLHLYGNGKSEGVAERR
jgi:hypothetical protein